MIKQYLQKWNVFTKNLCISTLTDWELQPQIKIKSFKVFCINRSNCAEFSNEFIIAFLLARPSLKRTLVNLTNVLSTKKIKNSEKKMHSRLKRIASKLFLFPHLWGVFLQKGSQKCVKTSYVVYVALKCFDCVKKLKQKQIFTLVVWKSKRIIHVILFYISCRVICKLFLANVKK